MAKRTLNKLSTKDLQEEIQRRRRRLPALERRKNKLEVQLREVEDQISALSQAGGPGRRGGVGGRRTRPKNDLPLGDLIVEILKKDQPKRVADIAREALQSGYKTQSENFSTIVNQALLKDDRFTSSERGYYKLA